MHRTKVLLRHQFFMQWTVTLAALLHLRPSSHSTFFSGGKTVCLTWVSSRPLSHWQWRRPRTAGMTTLTEQLRLGAAVWPLGSQRSVEISVFAWPACPCLFLTIIRLSVEQHLSSCLCVASLFMVVNTMEERTC